MNNPFPNTSNFLVLQQIEFDEQIFFSPPTIQDFETEDAFMRVIRNKEFRRPKGEHIHEFIEEFLLLTLGDKWLQEQKQLPFENCHEIIKWIKYKKDFFKSANQNYGRGDMVYPNGYTKELFSLAADIYYLNLVGKIPKELLNRLKLKDQFRGARYEIGIAAAFIRSGFRIEWLKQTKNKKNHEFDVVHKFTNEKIAIEAKKLNRNETAQSNLLEHGGTELDIFRNYNQALEQNPRDRPFGVFIDIDLPHFRPEHSFFWKESLFDLYLQKKVKMFDYSGKRFSVEECPPPSFLVITNSAWHYEQENRAGKGENSIIFRKKAKFPIKNLVTMQAIEKAVRSFGKLPTDTLM
jgi:hypothetical protein